MDYPLCLRSSKPIFPKLSKPITNMISARIISTKPILFSPQYYLPTNNIILSSKRSIMNNNSHFCTNYHLYPRASSDDHHAIDDVAAIADLHSTPAPARGPGASIAAACILGVLCCGAALMIGPQKAAARWPRISTTICESCGGSGGRSSSDHQGIYPMTPKDVVISLSKVKRFFDQKEAGPSDSAIKDFEKHKKNALIKIKKGENIEKALTTMLKERGMRGSVGSYDIKVDALEILIAQGNFNKAFDTLKSLEKEVDFIPSDPRPLLYQAIIYSIRNDKDHFPEEYWEKFFKVVKSSNEGPDFMNPPTLP